MTAFVPTRAAALAAMHDFAPVMGKRYENGRNYDRGAGNHKAVSQLSPYLSRRLITEREVAQTAIATHGPENAAKFVDEVIWRSYFKGWLERRPQVWDSYVQGLQSDLADLDRDRRLRRDVARAQDGATGLDYFDTWAQELVETGYLHNHARMWFASIWIFTLELPWRLGADFFYRHLLDGDAASNTLSWRWAAGLHTRGKPYPARAKNIATFTAGRFSPREADLAEVTDGLEGTEPDGLPDVQPLRTAIAPKPGLPSGLLITDMDCSLHDFDLSALELTATATLRAAHLRSTGEVAQEVAEFETGALTDTATRRGGGVTPLEALHPDTLAKWARTAGITQIVTPYVTRGPLYDWMEEARLLLTRDSITVTELCRPWDAAIWPYATAGFFKVKKQIPRIREEFLDL